MSEYIFKNLSQKDVEILKKYHVLPTLPPHDSNSAIDLDQQQKELEQIDRFIDTMIFELTIGDSKPEIVSAAAARAILGQEEFLSGLARACFHHTADREGKTEDIHIMFDASPCFAKDNGEETEEINHKELLDTIIDSWCDSYGIDNFIRTFAGGQLNKKQLEKLGFEKQDIERYGDWAFWNKIDDQKQK